MMCESSRQRLQHTSASQVQWLESSNGAVRWPLEQSPAFPARMWNPCCRLLRHLKLGHCRPRKVGRESCLPRSGISNNGWAQLAPAIPQLYEVEPNDGNPNTCIAIHLISRAPEQRNGILPKLQNQMPKIPTWWDSFCSEVVHLPLISGAK